MLVYYSYIYLILGTLKDKIGSGLSNLKDMWYEEAFDAKSTMKVIKSDVITKVRGYRLAYGQDEANVSWSLFQGPSSHLIVICSSK